MTRAQDFWSRRKARVEAEAVQEARLDDAADAAARETEAAGKSDAELLEDLGLPDPDTLREGDDFTGFMARGVPERLRRRALRRLWTSNAVLANVDGLVDYGEDYTDAATVVDGMKTAYRVGKGMLAHIEALAAEAEAKAGAEAPADADDMPQDTAPSDDAPPMAAVAEASAGPEPDVDARTAAPTRLSAQADMDATDDMPAAPPRRSLRFVFDTDAGAAT